MFISHFIKMILKGPLNHIQSDLKRASFHYLKNSPTHPHSTSFNYLTML